VDKDIEELPPEISSIENPIFSCDPTLTLRKIQDDLDATEILGINRHILFTDIFKCRRLHRLLYHIFGTL
jgi:hypothetical protein